ncbi:hypothetical protein L1887_12451 [Cichorium endivia]|nr:hypothetical protein L1887_12451 [Cichorium endivia]
MLVFSVVMLMTTFAATLILTINSGRKWKDITLYATSFFRGTYSFPRGDIWERVGKCLVNYWANRGFIRDFYQDQQNMA